MLFYSRCRSYSIAIFKLKLLYSLNITTHTHTLQIKGKHFKIPHGVLEELTEKTKKFSKNSSVKIRFGVFIVIETTTK